MTGPPGMGKSALLARFSESSAVTFAHFTAADSGSTDWTTLCRQLLERICAHYRLSVEIPDEPDELRRVFARLLRDSAERDPITLVLDGLDQLEDRDGALDLAWLPPNLPSTVRVVASCLPGRTLDALTRRGYRPLAIRSLTFEEQSDFATTFLGRYGKSLSDRELAAVLGPEGRQTPYFLWLLLEELLQHGEYETIFDRVQLLSRQPDVAALLSKILARWEVDFDRSRPGLVAESFRLIHAARAGLSESELLDLLGDDHDPLPRALWTPLRQAARAVLTDRNGRLQFTHQQARDAVVHRYLARADSAAADHRRLADYFSSGTPALSYRAIEELPWQLLHAHDYPRLRDLLSEPEFVDAQYGTRRFEFRELWARLDRLSDHGPEDAFAEIITSPSAFSSRQVFFAARMFLILGWPGIAEQLYQHLHGRRSTGSDEPLLEQVLRDRAAALRLTGRLSLALALLREQEQLCRRPSRNKSLLASLGNQVNVSQDLGRMREAHEVATEFMRVCDAVGDREDLMHGLAHGSSLAHARGNFDEVDRLLDRAETIALERGDPGDLGDVLEQRAGACLARGRPDEALALLARVEELCTRAGDQHQLAHVYGAQAIALRARNDLAAAVEHHEKHRELYRRIRYRQQLQKALGEFGLTKVSVNNDAAAMDMFLEQQTICRELGMVRELARSKGLQALVHAKRGDSARALELHRAEAKVMRDLGDPNALGRALTNLARLHREHGEYAEALTLHAEVSELCESVDNPVLDAHARETEAGTRHRIGDLPGARRRYEEAAEISLTIGNRRGLAFALKGLAEVSHQQGDDASALETIKRSALLADEVGLIDLLFESLDLQATILMARKDFDAALSTYRRHEELARAQGTRRRLAAVLVNTARVLIMTRIGNGRPMLDDALEIARADGYSDIAGAALRLRRVGRVIRPRRPRRA